MPHRATYFFPRQFPLNNNNSNESSKKQLLDDHEKKELINTIKSQTYDDVESDTKKHITATSTTTTTNNGDVVVFSSGKHSAVSELFTGNDKSRGSKQKQVAALCNWLIEKKADHSHRSSSGHGHHGHVKPHYSRRRFSCEEGERELLLPPPPEETEQPPQAVKDAIDRSFDRQVSLPRLSSGSSYGGSLFSGTTTLDGNFSCDIKEETTSLSTARRLEEEEEEGENKETLAQKCKESFCLQISLAKRVTCLASLSADEPLITLDAGIETWDVESVSYRLWV